MLNYQNFPSDDLRNNLIQLGHLPNWINDYRFTDLDFEYFNKVVTGVDNYTGDIQLTLTDIFRIGLNIGSCGLTSRYMHYLLSTESSSSKKEKLLYQLGSLKALIGTKSGDFISKDGGHAWVCYDDMIYDPTLLVKIPQNLAKDLGYEVTRILSYESANSFSEYSLFLNDIRKWRGQQSNYNKFLQEICEVKELCVS